MKLLLELHVMCVSQRLLCVDPPLCMVSRPGGERRIMGIKSRAVMSLMQVKAQLLTSLLGSLTL